MKNLDSKEISQVSGGFCANEIATVALSASIGTVVGLATRGAMTGNRYTAAQLLMYGVSSAGILVGTYEGLEHFEFSKLG